MEEILELKTQRAVFEKNMLAIHDLAESEKRDLTDEEATRFEEAEAKAADLTTRIERAEKVQKIRVARDRTVVTPEAKAQAQYSISRAIAMEAKGKTLDGLEGEMHQEAVRNNPAIQGVGVPNMIVDASGGKDNAERAALSVGTATAAGNLVATNLQNQVIPSLQPNPVIFRAGATLYSGLQGNLDIPRETQGATAVWEGEEDDNAETTPAYDLINLRPNRVGAFTAITKTLLNQTGLVGDREISRLIREATASALDEQGLNGSGSPITGILNLAGTGSVAGGANGAVPSWANIVGLESEIMAANADLGSMAYVTTPGIRGAMKTTSKDTGSGQMIMTGNETNGYPVLHSTLMPSNLTKGTSAGVAHAIIFGVFADMLVGRWGKGFDIVVDPYSLKKKASLEIAVNSWWDIQFRHAESFAVMKDALTSPAA